MGVGLLLVSTTEEVTTRDRFSIFPFKDLLNITVVYHRSCYHGDDDFAYKKKTIIAH